MLTSANGTVTCLKACRRAQRAQVGHGLKAESVPWFSQVKGLNTCLGTEAQILTGSYYNSFVRPVSPGRDSFEALRGAHMEKRVPLCPPRPQQTLSRAVDSAPRRLPANESLRAEAVLQSVLAAQIAAQIWARAVATDCHRATVITGAVSLPFAAQIQYRLRCSFCGHIRSSDAINPPRSTDSDAFFRLAPICVRRAPRFRRSRSAVHRVRSRCGNPRQPVLPARQQSLPSKRQETQPE